MGIKREIENEVQDFVSELLSNPINFKKRRKERTLFTINEIKYLIQTFVKMEQNSTGLAVLDEIFEGCIIVGDLHGDILSTMRVTQPFTDGNYPAIVFLGDYVDRGDDSLLVLGYLIALAITWPSRIEILKGNHEDIEVNKKYGFLGELREVYSDKDEFEEVKDLIDLFYAYLCVAAKTNNGTLCVHGGIPNNSLLSDINMIPKPHFKLIMEADSKLRDKLLQTIWEITWNDPRENQREPFIQSTRSENAKFFNSEALSQYLIDSKCKRLVRAHEPSRGGHQIMFKNKLIHIFTSEPYFGRIKKGTVAIDLHDGMEIRDLDFNIITKLTNNPL